MAQSISKRGDETAYSRRRERRQIPHARLARLNQEFRADIAQLKKKHVLESVLVAASIVTAALGLGVLVYAAPTCSTPTATPTILIGEAFKVAGC
jgi:hypothetical protein